MNLLIVDDQESVINGLLDGIDWGGLSIDRVMTASNALEAKTIFEKEPVDIVLCDIEMPVESGIDLFHWVRKKEYSPYFVFLTSHAEFSYAQEALRLGAAEYIVQPAPYSEIVRVVTKAIAAVSKKREDEITRSQGQVLVRQQKRIGSGAIRSLLAGRIMKEVWQSLEEQGMLPKLKEPAYLVMVQIVRWNEDESRWEPALLEATLENVADEIFGACGQIAAMAMVDNDVCALLLQGRERELVSQKELVRQLGFLDSFCARYFKFDVACYFQEPEAAEKAGLLWKKLQTRAESNVLRQKGVFFPEADVFQGEPGYRLSKVKYWKKLLDEGYYQTVEEEAIGLLRQLSQQNVMNKETLRAFYQDFMQMLYAWMNEGGRALGSIFTTAEAMELYQSGTKSVQQMEELIHYALMNLGQEQQSEDIDSQAVMRLVMDYIQNHLEEDLRRDDIAAYVHLNRDYLSRMFSREMGISLKEFITEQKMKAAQGMLRTTGFPISFIGAKLGYCNSSHFSFTYKKVMGRTPKEERALKES